MNVDEEPRSFAQSEEPELQTKPIPTRNPSNAALAKGVNAVHECLEEARADIDKLTTASDRLEGAMDVLLTALELPKVAQIAKHGAPEQPRAALKSSAHITRGQLLVTAATTFSGFGGFLLFLKVLSVMLPGIWHALLAAG